MCARDFMPTFTYILVHIKMVTSVLVPITTAYGESYSELLFKAQYTQLLAHMRRCPETTAVL